MPVQETLHLLIVFIIVIVIVIFIILNHHQYHQSYHHPHHHHQHGQNQYHHHRLYHHDHHHHHHHPHHHHYHHHHITIFTITILTTITSLTINIIAIITIIITRVKKESSPYLRCIWPTELDSFPLAKTKHIGRFIFVLPCWLEVWHHFAECCYFCWHFRFPWVYDLGSREGDKLVWEIRAFVTVLRMDSFGKKKLRLYTCLDPWL